MATLATSPADARLGKPIRVLHLHSSLGVYGAERWTQTLLAYTNSADVESLVVTLGSKPGARNFHDTMTELGFKTRHIDARGKFSLEAIRKLRKLVASERIDIVHSHGFKPDVIALVATRALAVRLVSTPHGWSADESFLIRFYELIDRLALRYFDAVFPLSPAMAMELAQALPRPGRVRLIRNAVDVRRYDALYRENNTRDSSRPLRVLFVGRLCRPKGIFELVDATALALGTCALRLTLLGDGPDREALGSAVENHAIGQQVSFAGYVDDVRPHFAEADVLVLPSYSEGIPRTVMEAFAAGVPVIGTAIPGIEELVTDGQTGLLVPPREVAALAAAICRIAGDAELARELSRKARERVEVHFSGERLAAEFTNYYSGLAQGPLPKLASA